MQQPKRDPHDLPTALLVTEGEPEADSFKRRLKLLGLAVEEASPDEAARAAFVGAPDLVVLAGVGAEDGGLTILSRLAEHHATRATPVVVIGRGGQFANAGRAALRHGVVAIIDRAEGVDAMARGVVGVARSLSRRTGQLRGVLGEQALDALVALLTESRRSGMLSVRDGVGAVVTHLVVRGDRAVDETIAELAARLRAVDPELVGPFRYEFVESSSAALSAVRAQRPPSTARKLMHRRLALIERDPALASPIVEALRAVGSRALVIEEGDDGLAEARRLMPSVILVDSSALEDWAADVVREIQDDPLLGWASLLVVEHAATVRDGEVDMGALASGILELLQPDLELVARLRARPSVEARLEVIGPARTLRAIADAQHAVHVTVRHPRVRLELDVVDGRVHEAKATLRAGRSAEGTDALATLLHLPAARVSCARFDPAQTGIGQPLDDALREAASARPAIPRVSAPITSPAAEAFDDPTLPGRPSGSQVALLVDRLEHLLGVGEETDEETERRRMEELPALEETEDDEDVPTNKYDPRVMARFRQRLAQDRAAGVAAPPAPAAAAVPPPTSITAPELSAPPPASAPAPTRPEAAAPGPSPRGARSTQPLAAPRPPTPTLRDGAAPPWEDPVDAFDGEPTSADLRLAHLDDIDDIDDFDGPTLAGAPPSLEALAPVDELGDETILEPDPRHPVEDPAEVRPPAPEAVRTAALDRTTGVRIGVAIGVAVLAFVVGIGGAFLFATWSREEVIVAMPAKRASPSPAAATTRDDSALDDSAREEPASDESASDEPASDESASDESASDESASDESASDEPAPLADPETDEALPAEGAPAVTVGATDPAEPTEGADAPSTGVRTEPLEGLDSDFDLAALGVDGDDDLSRTARSRRVRALNRRGSAARRRGRWERAERSYRAVLGIAPRNGPATLGLAHVYRETGDARLAVLFAQRLVRLRPRQASSYVFLSDAFVLAEQPAAARAAAERALALDRGNRAARRRLRALDEP